MRDAQSLMVIVAFAALTAACTSNGDGSGPVTPADASLAASTDSGPDIDPLANLVLADIDVTVTYTGTDNSPLVVGAFATDPPTGAPVAHARIEMPTFPRQVKLRDVEKGTWYIVALLDHDPPSPTIPGDEDPLVTAPAITVVDDATQTVAITLPAKN